MVNHLVVAWYIHGRFNRTLRAHLAGLWDGGVQVPAFKQAAKHKLRQWEGNGAPAILEICNLCKKFIILYV